MCKPIYLILIAITLTLSVLIVPAAIAGDAKTRTRVLAPSGISRSDSKADAIELAQVKVLIDSKGFAQSVQREIDKGSPSEPLDELIWLNGQPQCIRLRFDDKKVSADTDYRSDHLLIFPLAKYAALYEKEIDRRKGFAEKILLLEKSIAGSSAKNVQEIPIFPVADAAQMAHAQEHCLKFKNGAGIAFICNYGNGSAPLTEDSQFYCFQGLTNDKRFYISFFAPVKTRGIPKGDFLDSVASVKKMPPKSYIPNLEILDKMICSLEIK